MIACSIKRQARAHTALMRPLQCLVSAASGHVGPSGLTMISLFSPSILIAIETRDKGLGDEPLLKKGLLLRDPEVSCVPSGPAQNFFRRDYLPGMYLNE